MASVLLQWKDGLSRTSRVAFGQIVTLLGASEIKDGTWSDLESLLVQADLGLGTTSSILDSLKRYVQAEGLTRGTDYGAALRRELLARLEPPPVLRFDQKPAVILVVGVNGSGKTTTIAKLASRFQSQGKTTLLGAADTFRAAAVDQLQVWGERLKVDVIAGAPESDSGAVAFNTVQAGVARNADVILIDTAGRLHSRLNLMEELKKVHRVLKKAILDAPHHVWLIIDATTGQNALQQARAFSQAVNVTGIILAKLDSTARGGMAFAIQRELGLPILYAGLGEMINDLQPFDPQAFVDGILSIE